MRAVDITHGKGPASALFINDNVPQPTPTGSQALIRVKAFGLNRADTMQREGNYPVPPGVTPIMGLEFAGVVERLGGEAESGFGVGDEVFGLAYGGAYAEYVAVSTHMLIHKPKELSWEECAGIPETWMTATQAMYLVANYKPGESILWHAGASSVSLAGIQLSKADQPATVFASTRSDEKNEFLMKTFQLDATFNTKTHADDWADQLLKATDGNGVDIIIDYAGPDSFGGNLQAAARDGRIVNLAALSGTKIKGGEDFSAFVRKRVRFEGSNLRGRDEVYQGKLRDQLVEHALPKLVDGSFKVHIEKVFDWRQIREAHELMESNQTKGKLICLVT